MHLLYLGEGNFVTNFLFPKDLVAIFKVRIIELFTIFVNTLEKVLRVDGREYVLIDLLSQFFFLLY